MPSYFIMLALLAFGTGMYYISFILASTATRRSANLPSHFFKSPSSFLKASCTTHEGLPYLFSSEPMYPNHLVVVLASNPAHDPLAPFAHSGMPPQGKPRQKTEAKHVHAIMSP